MPKPKFFHASRFIQRSRIVRTMGLDTDILVAFLLDDEDFTMFRPKVFNRNNSLFINYKVFSEAMNVLSYKYKYDLNKARDKIFDFLRSNRIRLLKKKETDIKLVFSTLSDLKNHRNSIKNLAGDNDLEIISIYKAHNIDCIMGRNGMHFIPFCNYLHIEFEKLQENIDIMFRQAFGWKRRKKL